uniref:Uncharacterized protein n=1 Tax=Globisporangium ultimum (strain ATCC 200006 / CBS 805.95 / DAOM BR144) TaxID=431595 RepID=K3X2W3_GLOUD
MAATGHNKAAPRTQYGTSSLESDDVLGGHAARRSRIVKWGATALVAGAGAALIALAVTRSRDSTSPSATASTSTGGVGATVGTGASVLGWQSSYINGETKMMEPITGLKWKKRAESTSSTSFIAVDASTKFQEMLGFGGAFTEAAALQFAKLSPEKQEEVLKLYFDKEDGAAYEFGRVPMGSCDFSVGSYSFDDVANDTTMSHFDNNVEHDTKLLIPFIQRALEKNPKLKMFLAPWSPPAWMKHEKDYYLQPMYYFIKHFSKFVPPGSRRIHTDVSATFKKPGDAQLYVNYPVELHTCDNSARQTIHKTDDNKLQVTGTPFCIDLLRPDWVNRQVALVECQYTSQSWTFGSNGKISMAGYCLALNHGSTADGVHVTVNPCNDNEEPSHQLWNFKNGSMYSLASPKCVTAGYSFVQSVGFVTPENKKVLVVLNENTEDAEFELQYDDLALETVIPQGAIQTFTWE